MAMGMRGPTVTKKLQTVGMYDADRGYAMDGASLSGV